MRETRRLSFGRTRNPKSWTARLMKNQSPLLILLVMAQSDVRSNVRSDVRSYLLSSVSSISTFAAFLAIFAACAESLSLRIFSAASFAASHSHGK